MKKIALLSLLISSGISYACNQFDPDYLAWLNRPSAKNSAKEIIPPVSSAIIGGFVSRLRAALENGGNPNEVRQNKPVLFQVLGNSTWPQHGIFKSTASSVTIEQLKLLIEYKADLNAMFDDQSILQYALKLEVPKEIISLLLENGVNPDPVTESYVESLCQEDRREQGNELQRVKEKMQKLETYHQEIEDDFQNRERQRRECVELIGAFEREEGNLRRW